MVTSPKTARPTPSDRDLLLRARHWQPHAYLGLHASKNGQGGLEARAFVREAKSCEVVDIADEAKARYKLKKVDAEGLFEGRIAKRAKPFRYRLRVEKTNGEILQFYDPYQFLPTISEHDLYLVGQGNDHRVYDKLGSHVREVDGVRGVSFAVWAPSAKRVSVVGDFNHWDGRYHPMRALGASGIWELFIPGLEPGLKYKYELIGGDDALRIKTDPYAIYFEPPPHNASIICDIADYQWGDQAWLDTRARTDTTQQPVSVYEVHHGSWKRVSEDGNRPLSYREMAAELIAYVKDMGYTHVEFMPLAEHPFAGSWGYQVTGFYAPTHRFGTPQDFMYLVDQLHQNNIGVILDWVPAHFPRDTFALADFDGSHLYEHADPRQGQHQDWGTLIPNYGRHEVRGFLIGSALSWFERFHIDGLRVDAVASMLYLDYSRKDGEWIPNQYGGRENIEALEFLRSANDLVHQYYPGAMMIAEESTSFGGVTKPTREYGLGFDYKWNMGWMHDTLEYFKKDPIHRQFHHNQITFGMLYQYSENFITVFSHDEVVHGKGSMILKMGSWHMWEKARTLRALYALMWGWPGKKCLFMGCDFGQSSEWRYDAPLDWDLLQYIDHEGIRRTVRDLNHWYCGNPALAFSDTHGDAFSWINCNDGENSTLSFLRYSEDRSQAFLVVGNFTPVARPLFRVGVPYGGFWKESINTNASEYGGSGEGNCGGLVAEEYPWDDQPYSLNILLPGLTTLIFHWSA
ncbi:MAG: 1,4-alpha-glucan branching protein GlgB [Opitutales bacterium]